MPPRWRDVPLREEPEDRLLIGYGLVLVATLILSTVAGMLLRSWWRVPAPVSGDRSLATLSAWPGRGDRHHPILVGDMALTPQPPWWRESKLIPYAAALVKVARRMAPAQMDFRPLQQPPADLDKVTL